MTGFRANTSVIHLRRQWPDKIMKKSSSNFRLSHVHKRYGDVVAINDLSLEVHAGELITLLGPSGCGKTTMLRMIAGLEDATDGNIYIGNTDVTHLAASYRNVAMVFQSYALFPHMSVLENVSYGLSVSKNKMKKREQKAAALQGLEMVGLTGYEKRLPSELSGGQQQRVAVARAVVLEPEVLLFDEPLSNLDAKLRRHVRGEIRQIQQELGLTAVYVTHDQEEAMAVSDRIVVMKEGVIAQSGTAAEIYEMPNSEFIADFIGDANVVPCSVLNANEDRAMVEVHGVHIESRLTGPLKAASARLAIHPQDIHLSRNQTHNSLSGVVTSATYLGKHMEYNIATVAGDFFVVDNKIEAYFKCDDSVHLEFSPEKTALLPE